MTLQWGIAILDSTFYWRYSHSTRYSALGHTLLIDGWFPRWRFILRHSPLIGGGLWFILERSHFRWFLLGHSQFIRTHRAWGFWFIWIMLRCFHFSTRSRDWSICWPVLGMVFLSSCWLGYTPLHWGIFMFWREIRLILYVGASDKWCGDHWIISCYPYRILEHSHLVGCFDIEIWFPVCDYCFSMDYGAIDTSGLVFSAYLDDLGYLHTFHLVLRHFTLDTFMFSILPESDHHFLSS